MNERDKKVREIANGISKNLADKGFAIEGGWRALVIVSGLQDAPPAKLMELKRVYYSGAQHLFSVMLNMMDEDREPTSEDMRKMDLLHQELEKWTEEMRAQPNQ